MRKLLLLCALFGVAIESPAQTDLIARIHFAGGDRISTNPNSAAFTGEFCSAEARALESQTLDKMSVAPYAWFKSKIPAGSGNGAAQLRPLLDDFLRSEWVFEIRDTPGGSPEYALAIRLGSGRAALWSKNLAAVLQSWTGIGITPDPSGNWELRKHDAPDLIRFERRGDFVVIDCGENQLTLDKGIVGPFLKTKIMAADDSWLTTDLDWPRLGQIFPSLGKFDFPKIQMQVTGFGGNLHLNGKLILSQPLSPLKKWNVPLELIRQPFNSFTALRGIGPWLEKQDWAQPFLIQPVPDQLFIWGLPQIPLLTFAATPVYDANAALSQLDRNLSDHTGWQKDFIMPVQTTMVNQIISFKGVPFIAPFVQAASGPAGDFLLGGFMPNLPKSKPLPRELIDQLNQPNLVYYHWEDTSNRLSGILQLSQLSLLVTGHRQLTAQSDAYKWFHRLELRLGTTATQITQTAPNELTFERRAPGGLTAFEFLVLANWLEAKNFPGCDLRLPANQIVRPPSPNRHVSVMSMPAPVKK